jgi:hypothetical protein
MDNPVNANPATDMRLTKSLRAEFFASIVDLLILFQ